MLHSSLGILCIENNIGSKEFLMTQRNTNCIVSTEKIDTKLQDPNKNEVYLGFRNIGVE